MSQKWNGSRAKQTEARIEPTTGLFRRFFSVVREDPSTGCL